MSSRTIRLAVVGGDGIGPEVTAEALKVLRAATGAAWPRRTARATSLFGSQICTSPLLRPRARADPSGE